MILIIQNGNVTTHIYRYLDEESVVVKSFEIDVSLIDISLYTMVIILGGNQSICEKDNIDEHLKNVIKLINKCIESDKPLFGICLGCQLFAFVLGCKIRSTHKLNVGYDTKILNFKYILRCHTDHIIPNNLLEIEEYYDSMLYVFKYKKIYGVQCHPDIPSDHVVNFLSDKEIIDIAKKNCDIIEKNNHELIKYILKEIRS